MPGALLSAREQAADLVASAKAESAAIRAEAVQQGFEEGRAAGREAALAEVTELLVAARAHAESLRARGRDTALALARRMAEKIIRRAVALDQAAMAEIVSHALEASRAADGAVVVRVHPEDLAAVEGERPRFTERLAATASLRLLADPSVGRAGCVVETPLGRLDARLAAQLDALERAVAAPRPRPQG